MRRFLKRVDCGGASLGPRSAHWAVLVSAPPNPALATSIAAIHCCSAVHPAASKVRSPGCSLTRPPRTRSPFRIVFRGYQRTALSAASHTCLSHILSVPLLVWCFINGMALHDGGRGSKDAALLPLRNGCIRCERQVGNRKCVLVRTSIAV